jgi:hypothetical protein
MTQPIIKTDNYLLVVDDSEIKNWYLDDVGVVRKATTWDSEYWSVRKDYKKIIAHLPLNPPFIYGYTNSPVLEGVPLLPPLEDEVEKLADELYLEKSNRINDSEIRGYIVSATKGGFIDGYNKAKEKYKYTEEDMRNAIVKGFLMGMDREHDITEVVENFIQSLQQPKMPVAFECDIEYIGFQDEGDLEEPKSFINSQGFTQWVGRYIYE